MPKGTLSGFAPEVLAAAAEILSAPGESILVSLAGVRLDVRTKSPTYAKACRTALINDARYADEPQRAARILVADPENYPEFPVWAEQSEAARNAVIAEAHSLGWRAACNPDFNQWHFFDPERRIGLQLIPHADGYPHWEDSFPLLPFLHWLTMEGGRRIIHAASLGHKSRGVLIAGDSGAGKSGTALAGLLGGLECIGDDYVLIDLEGGGARGFPLTRIMKQDSAGLRRNGVALDNAGFWGPNWQGKYEAFVAEVAGREMPKQIDLTAILLPQITGGESLLRPVRKADAIHAMLPSNLMQVQGSRKYAMQFISELVRRLPVYRFELGREPGQIARIIADFLEGEAR